MWAVLSDSKPLFGYRRKPYLILMAFITFLCLMVFVLGNPTQSFGVVLLIILYIAQSAQNIIGQAIVVDNAHRMTRKNASSQEKNNAATLFEAIFFGSIKIGEIISYYLFANTSLIGSLKTPFLMMSLVPLAVLIASFFLPEDNKQQLDKELKV